MASDQDCCKMEWGDDNVVGSTLGRQFLDSYVALPVDGTRGTHSSSLLSGQLLTKPCRYQEVLCYCKKNRLRIIIGCIILCLSTYIPYNHIIYSGNPHQTLLPILCTISAGVTVTLSFCFCSPRFLLLPSIECSDYWFPKRLFLYTYSRPVATFSLRWLKPRCVKCELCRYSVLIKWPPHCIPQRLNTTID
jgi:hypothetical protein